MLYCSSSLPCDEEDDLGVFRVKWYFVNGYELSEE